MFFSIIFIHNYQLNSSQDVNLLNLLSSQTSIAMTEKSGLPFVTLPVVRELLKTQE